MQSECICKTGKLLWSGHLLQQSGARPEATTHPDRCRQTTRCRFSVQVGIYYQPSVPSLVDHLIILKRGAKRLWRCRRLWWRRRRRRRTQWWTSVAGSQQQRRRHADDEDLVTVIQRETATVVIVQRNIQRRCDDDGSQRPCWLLIICWLVFQLRSCVTKELREGEGGARSLARSLYPRCARLTRSAEQFLSLARAPPRHLSRSFSLARSSPDRFLRHALTLPPDPSALSRPVRPVSALQRRRVRSRTAVSLSLFPWTRYHPARSHAVPRALPSPLPQHCTQQLFPRATGPHRGFFFSPSHRTRRANFGRRRNDVFNSSSAIRTDVVPHGIDQIFSSILWSYDDRCYCCKILRDSVICRVVFVCTPRVRARPNRLQLAKPLITENAIFDAFELKRVETRSAECVDFPRCNVETSNSLKQKHILMIQIIITNIGIPNLMYHIVLNTDSE